LYDNLVKSDKIREASDRHTQLKTILRRSYVAGSKNYPATTREDIHAFSRQRIKDGPKTEATSFSHLQQASMKLSEATSLNNFQ